MNTEPAPNPACYTESAAADKPLRSESDLPGLTAWFDETDRALGACLARIENLAPDAVPHHAMRNELLFLLRAARADLMIRYLDATGAMSGRYLKLRQAKA